MLTPARFASACKDCRQDEKLEADWAVAFELANTKVALTIANLDLVKVFGSIFIFRQAKLKEFSCILTVLAKDR